MRRYSVPRNTRWLLRMRDGLLKKLGRLEPFVDGSVVLIARTCGNSQQCHCSRGSKHVSTYLTYKVKGKTHTLYVPVDLESQVRRWSERYHKVKALAAQVCGLQREMIRLYVQEKKRQQGRR